MHPAQPGVHRYPLRIYVQDTDVSGYVHHANYLKYAERARTEMLREAGIDHAGMMARGEGFWVVAEAKVKYHRPARLDDALTVLSRPVKVAAAYARLEHRIVRGDELVAEIAVTAAWILPDGRPQRQPGAWREAFIAIAAAAKEAW